jgi:hypothetical protein
MLWDNRTIEEYIGSVIDKHGLVSDSCFGQFGPICIIYAAGRKAAKVSYPMIEVKILDRYNYLYKDILSKSFTTRNGTISITRATLKPMLEYWARELELVDFITSFGIKIVG